MRCLLLAWCAVAGTTCAAATITIACPDKFPVESIQFSTVQSEWTPFAPAALEVVTAELMYGPPSSYTYAAPTTFQSGKRRDVGVWSASSTGKNWLQCGYGAGRELTLSRPLPPGVTDCTITKNKDDRGNVERVVAVCTLTSTLR